MRQATHQLQHLSQRASRLSKKLTAVQLFLALLLLMGPISARAAGVGSCAMALTALYEEAYYDENVYVPANCAQNIARLLTAAQAQGVDITQAQVIIVHASKMNQVRSDKMSGRSTNDTKYYPLSVHWNYHVFLIYQNEVFDFDFQNKPVHWTTQKYFFQAWAQSSVSNLNKFFKTRPITMYSMTPELFLQGTENNMKFSDEDLIAQGAQRTSLDQLLPK